MKSVTLGELETDLDKDPEDWSLRLRLIEGHILEDDIDTARRLVRESPDDSPLPPELQHRLHSAMTQGAAAVERYYASQPDAIVPYVRESRGTETERKEGQEEQKTGPSGNNGSAESDREGEGADTGRPSKKSPDSEKEEEKDSGSVASEAAATGGDREDDSERPMGKTEKVPLLAGVDSDKMGSNGDERRDKEPQKETRSEKKSGSGKESTKAVSKDGGKDDEPKAMVRPRPKPVEVPEGFEFGDEDDEEGAEDILFLAPEREPQGAQKISAFTTALIAHIALVLICGVVAIGLPPMEPPKIIAINVMSEREPIIAPVMVERARPKAASASAQPAAVISTPAQSDFAVPEFDVEAAPDVTVLMAGLNAGEGLSFEGAGNESSVNFFGIKSGGKRIAFIVDATKYMLVDNKGGMFAYDKVKAEVGAMLSQLKRGTEFNIILYEGRTLSLFREQPVAAKPSAVRLAIEWLDPLNRDYDALGLGRDIATRGGVKPGVGIVEARDIHSYAKAIQAALEMDVNAVFAICNGYYGISRSLTAEQMEEVRKMNEGRTRGTVDPADRARWNQAVAKTREWLRKENAARAEKGIAPKVVINFNSLVRQITGATPPSATGGSPAPAGMPRPGPPYTPDEIEDHFDEVVKHYYKSENKSDPEVHVVLFLGEDEDLNDNHRDHFRRLTRKNQGKLKILKGLAALSDVTGR